MVKYDDNKNSASYVILMFMKWTAVLTEKKIAFVKNILQFCFLENKNGTSYSVV